MNWRRNRYEIEYAGYAPAVYNNRCERGEKDRRIAFPSSFTHLLSMQRAGNGEVRIAGLSVSDVVVLHQNGQDAAHYVDSFGYKSVPEFLQEQKQLTPDELETGETIKTPRGTFYVTDMSREQMEAAGYGFHHQSDDGKYLIMGNGTRAFAIAAEQRENPLKAAEQTTEQNENMIDGIINNTPTVDELEAKVKAGETISLVDLANAVKADKERGKAKSEKKPSIRAQLKADKEKAQKKAAAKTKNHDLEV